MYILCHIFKVFAKYLEGTPHEPDVIMGAVIKKTPEVIELLDSDDDQSANVCDTPEDERKKRKIQLTKRLHRKRKTPCE